MPTSKIDPLIPFILPSGLVVGRMGRGEIVQVTEAATGTDFALTVHFNRIPIFVLALWNNVNYQPKIRLSSTTPAALNTITIQVDTACPAPGCWFYVL